MVGEELGTRLDPVDGDKEGSACIIEYRTIPLNTLGSVYDQGVY